MSSDQHNHHQHHQDMAVNTPVKTMGHAHHMMPQLTTNTTSMHSGHNSHANHMSMGMTFHAGFQEQILFAQWNTQTVGAFVGSCFLIFFIAVLYEGLKTVRDHLAKSEARRYGDGEGRRQSPLVRHDAQQNDRPAENNLLPSVRTENVRAKRARLLSGYHIVQTLLHVLQMGISYLLMLIAMTFNVYLFLAVILGAGLGHFLFGWRRSSIIDYNEHCH